MAGKFTKNTIITIITRILQLLFGIGASVIIARILGPEGKGIYSLAILLPTLLVTFTNLGLGPASVYYIGKKRYSPREVFGANIVYSIFISVVAIFIGLIVIFFFAEKFFPGVKQEYLLLALSLIPFQLFLAFVIDVLLGLQKIKKYNLINLANAFIFLLLIAIFLLGFRFGIKAAIFTEILSFAITCIVLFFQVRKEIGGLIMSLNKEMFQDFFSYGAKIYIGNILGFLHYRINMFLINIFLNPLAVGLFSIAVGLAEKIWLVSQSAGLVLFPKVSSETDGKRLKEFTPLVFRNVLFITILMAALLFLLGHWIIILLYSEKFSDSILPFQILLIGAITLSGARILANDISGRGKPILNSYVVAASVILNIILNILWIPKVGIAGAAWATAASYTFTLIVMIIVYSKISGNEITDIIFIKKSDFRFYKNFLTLFKEKYLKSSK